jgi:hypothetical protein
MESKEKKNKRLGRCGQGWSTPSEGWLQGFDQKTGERAASDEPVSAWRFVGSGGFQEKAGCEFLDVPHFPSIHPGLVSSFFAFSLFLSPKIVLLPWCASFAYCISHHAVAWVCSTCRRDLPPRVTSDLSLPHGFWMSRHWLFPASPGCRAPLTDVVTRPPLLPHSPNSHPCHQPPNPTNTGALRPIARGLMPATVAATGTCVCSDQYGVTEYHFIDPSTMLLG